MGFLSQSNAKTPSLRDQSIYLLQRTPGTAPPTCTQQDALSEDGPDVRKEGRPKLQKKRFHGARVWPNIGPAGADDR